MQNSNLSIGPVLVRAIAIINAAGERTKAPINLKRDMLLGIIVGLLAIALGLGLVLYLNGLYKLFALALVPVVGFAWVFAHHEWLQIVYLARFGLPIDYYRLLEYNITSEERFAVQYVGFVFSNSLEDDPRYTAPEVLLARVEQLIAKHDACPALLYPQQQLTLAKQGEYVWDWWVGIEQHVKNIENYEPPVHRSVYHA